MNTEGQSLNKIHRSMNSHLQDKDSKQNKERTCKREKVIGSGKKDDKE